VTQGSKGGAWKECGWQESSGAGDGMRPLDRMQGLHKRVDAPSPTFPPAPGQITLNTLR
jgi:hypothetical protein